MDMETARKFELHNKSYNWKRNTRRAQELHEQGYTWEYDATSYAVFCGDEPVSEMSGISGANILDNFLYCLRLAEAHMWRTQ